MSTTTLNWNDHIRMRASANFDLQQPGRIAAKLLPTLNYHLQQNGVTVTLSEADVKSWIDGTATPASAPVRTALYEALQFKEKNRAALEVLYNDTPEAARTAYTVIQQTRAVTAPVPAPDLNDEAGFETAVTTWRAAHHAARNAREHTERVARAQRMREGRGPGYSYADAQRDLAAVDAAAETAAALQHAAAPAPGDAAHKPVIIHDTPVSGPVQRVTKETYLRNAREALGMEWRDVAFVLGISYETIKGIEYSKGNPSGPTGLRLADFYEKKQQAIIADEVANKIPEADRKPLFFDREEFDSLPQQFSAEKHAAKHRLLAAKRKEAQQLDEGQGRG